jgi:hypothetical protein
MGDDACWAKTKATHDDKEWLLFTRTRERPDALSSSFHAFFSFHAVLQAATKGGFTLLCWWCDAFFSLSKTSWACCVVEIYVMMC